MRVDSYSRLVSCERFSEKAEALVRQVFVRWLGVMSISKCLETGRVLPAAHIKEPNIGNPGITTEPFRELKGIFAYSSQWPENWVSSEDYFHFEKVLHPAMTWRPKSLLAAGCKKVGPRRNGKDRLIPF